MTKASKTPPKVGEAFPVAKELQGRRDAFHFPGVLVTSSEELEPGQNVQFDDQNFLMVSAVYAGGSRHGFVDPTLQDTVGGDSTSFWVFLIPGMAEDLTHNFKINTLKALEVRLSGRGEDEEYNECQNCN